MEATAYALVMAPPPGPERAAMAEAVILGRVTAIEDKDVKVGGTMYRIAVVNVTEAIKGTKEKTIRVGFVPTPKDRPDRPGFGNRGDVQYTVGHDGLFFLHKGPESRFYVTPGFGMFIPGNQDSFKKDVADAKFGVAVAADPMKHLKSEKANERFFAAALLINKYRQPTENPKTEPIDAAESKLILKALAGADWNAEGFGLSHPFGAFSMLNLTNKDGWNPPQEVQDIRDLYRLAQKWLEKNADTYRIQRNVPGKANGKANGKGGETAPPSDVIDPPVRIQPAPPIRIQPRPPIRIQPLPVLPVEPAPLPPVQPVR
jgi:hypothetical protein